jgi:hypothetical protein
MLEILFPANKQLFARFSGKGVRADYWCFFEKRGTHSFARLSKFLSVWLGKVRILSLPDWNERRKRVRRGHCTGIGIKG